MAVAVMEEAMEEAMAEATGKLKEKASEEGPMRAFSFCSIFVGSNPDFHKLL